MKYIIASVCGILGWIACATSTFVWGIKAIYELVKTDASFWSIAFTNIGGWIATLIVGFILLFIAYLAADS